MKIKNIRKEHYEGYVYNIAVENNHNYYANNILVHNCYEGNTPNGKFADILNQKWVDTLHPYTELAIGGNEPLHPDLVPFLEKLKAKKVFASMTVNQSTFERYFGLISKLCNDKLIYGLGVSLVDPNPDFLAKFKMFPNGVLHVINGVITKKQIDALRGKDLKMLILGYKNLGRGIDYLKHEEDVVLSNQAVLKSEMALLTSSLC